MQNIKLSIVGDICIPEGFPVPKLNQIDHKIKEDFTNQDLTIGNLECPITLSNDAIEKNGPHLRGSEEFLSLLKEINFNLFTLGNNHIMDYGIQGLKDTVASCEKNNIQFTGVDFKDINSFPYYYTYEKEGIKLGILNVAEIEFSSTTKKDPGALRYDLVEIYKQIKKIKKHCDKLILIIHGGIENFELPSSQQVKDYRFLAEVGADMIICHHSHKVSGYEIYNGTPIFYGIGNFMFHAKQKPNDWYIGMQLNILISDKIVFEIKINQYDIKTNTLRRVSKQKYKVYKSLIERLSHIIKDEELLEQELDLFADLHADYYFKVLHNKTSRWQRILIDRFKMHSLFLKKEQNLRLINYFYCDSHSFMIKKILKKLNDKKAKK
tara:strand:+ start:3109 stop:4248 length:1140 start_codon:yes stop_codon:yes gene_type:complete